MTFHIIEVNDQTGQREHLDRRKHESDAVAVARAHLACLPSSTIEAGFTVIVEDNAGTRVWGVKKHG